MIFNEDGYFYDEELRLEIDEEGFKNRFGNLESYEDLYNHENTTEAWKKVFDSWRDRDIIK